LIRRHAGHPAAGSDYEMRRRATGFGNPNQRTIGSIFRDMIFAFALLLLGGGSSAAIAYLLRDASEGFEDKMGFHFAR
jgi:hypothetical protein